MFYHLSEGNYPQVFNITNEHENINKPFFKANVNLKVPIKHTNVSTFLVKSHKISDLLGPGQVHIGSVFFI